MPEGIKKEIENQSSFKMNITHVPKIRTAGRSSKDKSVKAMPNLTDQKLSEKYENFRNQAKPSSLSRNDNEYPPKKNTGGSRTSSTSNLDIDKSNFSRKLNQLRQRLSKNDDWLK